MNAGPQCEDDCFSDLFLVISFYEYIAFFLSFALAYAVV